MEKWKKFTSNYKFLNSKNTFYNILPMSYLGGHLI